MLFTVLKDDSAELVHRLHGLGFVDIVFEVDHSYDSGDGDRYYGCKVDYYAFLASVHFLMRYSADIDG